MHLTQLLILQGIIDGTVTSSTEICERHGISDRTLKRYIEEFRNFGAVLESRRRQGGYEWHCANAKAIVDKGILQKWLAIERARGTGLV